MRLGIARVEKEEETAKLLHRGVAYRADCVRERESKRACEERGNRYEKMRIENEK